MKPVIKNTTRDNFSPANKSQTVGKGHCSDQQTIPGLPNLSPLGTLTAGLFPVGGEPHFMPWRTELVLQTQSSITGIVWVLENEVQSSISFRGYICRTSQTWNLDVGGRDVLPVSLFHFFQNLFALSLDLRSCCDFISGRLCFKLDSCTAF